MIDNPKLRLYLEGIKSPLKSVTRVQQAGEPVECKIELYPTAKGRHIKRGTSVQVYFWDDDRTNMPKITDEVKNKRIKGVWRVFFDGYVFLTPGISRDKSGGRALTLHCQDHGYRLGDIYIKRGSIGAIDINANKDTAFYAISPTKLSDAKLGTADQTSAINTQTVVQNALVKDGIAAAVSEYMRKSADFDRMFNRLNSIYKIEERFGESENAAMQALLKSDSLVSILTKQISAMEGETTLMGLMNAFLIKSFYNILFIGSPFYDYAGKEKKDQMQQYNFVPQIFFGVPPACNMIFPIQLSSFSQQDKINPPTRYAMYGSARLMPEGTGGVTGLRTMKEFFPERIAALVRQEKIAEAMGGDMNKVYTDEELVEDRVRPTFSRLPFGDIILSDEKTDDQSNNMLRVYGKYHYHIARNSLSSLQATLSFDPYLVCGLPSMIYDDTYGYILGKIHSITDVIAPQQKTMSTTITLVNLRLVDEGEPESEFKIEDYESLFVEDGEDVSEDMSNTKFFDSIYRDENIGDEVYRKIIGCGSMMDSVVSEDDVTLDLAFSDAVRRYKVVSGDRVSQEEVWKFVNDFKFRNIATQGHLAAFMGMEENHADNLDISADKNFYRFSRKNYKARYKSIADVDDGADAPFMEERQDIVKDYVKQIQDNFFALKE